MNVTALITAALTAVAEFFGWKREEAKGDKGRADTLQAANEAREAAQKRQRDEQKKLDESLKRGDRDHFGDDW